MRVASGDVNETGSDPPTESLSINFRKADDDQEPDTGEGGEFSSQSGTMRSSAAASLDDDDPGFSTLEPLSASEAGDRHIDSWRAGVADDGAPDDLDADLDL